MVLKPVTETQFQSCDGCVFDLDIGCNADAFQHNKCMTERIIWVEDKGDDSQCTGDTVDVATEVFEFNIRVSCRGSDISVSPYDKMLLSFLQRILKETNEA